MLKPVIQEDITGCAIATAATLARISYEEAKKSADSLNINIHNPTLWSSTQNMRRLLAELDINVNDKEHPFTTWDALPNRAILAIKWHLEKGIPHWHWVTFVREGENMIVLDPKKALKTNLRTDFGRIKPKWFIEVINN